MNRIITISREFGSGGREIGRRLAEKMGIAYYDQEIITELINRTDFQKNISVIWRKKLLYLYSLSRQPVPLDCQSIMLWNKI